MKKKILAVFLSLCMAMSLLPMTALATETTDTETNTSGTYMSDEEAIAAEMTARIGEEGASATYYSTLVDAVAAVEANGTVYLIQDASGNGIGTYASPQEGQIQAKSFTIDFGTHTYTIDKAPVGSTSYETQAFHLEWAGAGNPNFDVTLQNGTITSTTASGVKMLVQNYCNLTLDGMTLNGQNIGAGQYVSSNNCGNVTIKDSTIIAPNNGYAFDSCDFSSYTGVTVTVENSNIQGKIGDTNDNGDDDNSSIILKAGSTFTTDKVYTDYNNTTAELSQYVATGYKLEANSNGTWTVTPAAEGGMAVTTPSTIGNTTSATLEGYYQNADTDIDEGEGGTGSEVSATGVTVDLTSKEPATTTGTVELTVNADTANSLANNSANSLVVKSNVGTVTLDKAALGELADVTVPVVISIEATKEDDAAPTWEVTVKEGKEELFAETTDVEITITVPAPAGATADNTKVYCIDNGGMENMNAVYDKDESTLTWTTKHLSTFAAVTLNGEEASWVVNGTPQTTGKGTLKDALEAVDADGGTITLYKDAAALENANYTIQKPVTITGTGTITATNPSIHAFTISDESSLTLNGVKLKITGDKNYGIDVRYGATLTLNNAEIDVSGVSNATISASSGSTSKEPGKFILNNSKIAATDIVGNFSNGGDWELTNSSIEIEDCASNGFSCNSATLDNSKVSVSGAKLMGVTAKKITLNNDSAVTVEECGTNLPKESNWATDGERYKHPVEIKKGGKVTIDSTSSMVLQNNANNNNTIYFVESTLDNNGTLQANVVTKAPDNSFSVTVKNGSTVLDVANVTSGKTYTLPAALPNQGYNHFVGWNDGSKTHDAGAQVPITADTTFTAVWSYIPPANPNYRIDIPDFEGGTVTADPAAAKAGATVTLTATPDEGYAVGTITVTDRFGDAVKVTENADGTYTFTMPNGQVTVKATFVETQEPAPAEPFPDVDENDWFYDEVVYVYENGLMNGVENNRFAPNTATNRAMLATILYRLAGEPAVSGDLPFTDVESGTWYTDAVLWAAQNGIVNGLGENTFAPMNTLTREQLVTMLYRYAEAEGYDVSAAADLSGYPDAGKVQPYAQEAMSWAVAEGIVEGMDGNLNPAGSATRAQIATILMRFCEGVAK